ADQISGVQGQWQARKGVEELKREALSPTCLSSADLSPVRQIGQPLPTQNACQVEQLNRLGIDLQPNHHELPGALAISLPQACLGRTRSDVHGRSSPYFRSRILMASLQNGLNGIHGLNPGSRVSPERRLSPQKILPFLTGLWRNLRLGRDYIGCVENA